ncbi:hypothetical protein BJF78_33695 [Pseudonocardia sp. CNS-139]|nr:hypothetical protein BJF78_33695 [Pseudonocardia sp. CNS-139]
MPARTGRPHAAAVTVTEAPRRRSPVLPLVLDVAAPLGVSYALHAAGVPDVVALAAGAVPPAARAVTTLVRGRRVEPVGVAVLLAMLLATVASLITGDPRELLVRGALLSLRSGCGRCCRSCGHARCASA